MPPRHDSRYGGVTLACAVALLAAHTASAAVPWSAANTLFGTAIKNGPLPGGTELTTFQHNCTSAPCVVTQLHIPSIYPTGSCPWDWENGRLRMYIDGEATASIDVSLLEVAHVGSRAATGNSPPSDGSPFGHDLFGKTAQSGGVYSTVRIPFGTSLRTTITAPPSCATGNSIYWFIIRGIEGLSVNLGDDLELPAGARLQLSRVSNLTVQPLQFVTIASQAAGSAGALLAVDIDAESTDENFLEACFRFYPDGAATPTFLSSGVSDCTRTAGRRCGRVHASAGSRVVRVARAD